MTRLFLRFYIGVISILLMAWFIQGFVYRQRSQAENLQVVEQALSGGARLALAQVDAAPPQELGKALTTIQAKFEYPVQLVSLPEQPWRPALRKRIEEGEVVYYDRGQGGFVAAALPDRTRGLVFGPLPSFVGPSQAEMTLGFGVVLLLAALAIAILLRPVARQLRAVERAASAIADGDLSARIRSRQVPKGLPLANAFNTMADRVENLLRLQREMLQAVSHELRTPLARIRFATDLISSASTDAEREERLAAVDRATGELDDLVGELLTYIRLESADRQEIECFDLRELATEIVDSRRGLYPEIDFRIEADNQQHETEICSDPTGVARALGNLIGNAGKFARQTVIIRWRLEAQTCVVQVDDDGPGVPSDQRQRIFEPFVRLADSPGRGAGLGLALVQRIVHQHNGQVVVSDSPLGGARFELRWPLKAPSAERSSPV